MTLAGPAAVAPGRVSRRRGSAASRPLSVGARLDAPGLLDRHDLGTTTVFAESGRNRRRGKATPGGSRRDRYLKEQQWTNPFATAQVREAEFRTAVRVPATIIRSPAAKRSWRRRRLDGLPPSCCRLAIASRPGRLLGRLEPRLSAGGDDRATLDAEVAEAQAALEARARRAGTGGTAPGRTCRACATGRRSAPRHDDRRSAAASGGGPSRAARQTLGTGGGAAAGNAFVAARANRPDASRRSAPHSALLRRRCPLFRIVRTDESNCRRRCQRPTSPLHGKPRTSRSNCPGARNQCHAAPHA